MDFFKGKFTSCNLLHRKTRNLFYCLGFDIASERGHRRDDVSPGLRIVGFERRVTIAFVADENQVTILRLFYGGQNWEDKLQ
jgi:toxin ParE1/3/4